MSHLSNFPDGLQRDGASYSHAESEIESVLLALKAAAVRATEKADVAFYADYLADDAIGVTPFGIFNKQQILQGMKDGKSFKSSKIEDSRAVALGEEAGLVTYRATFEVEGRPASEFFVSTLYRRFADGWKGVFYQQTPLPAKS
ncbi:MAG TPA: nuclear transport factor 2 family protein [Steroidobacteraceae bacterium]|jgi:hypothetical protein|nr:nuclear transport factor 2 family protein [Steroidobacteraceae bacterium]